jgi:outer membrane protein TolC
MSLGRFMEGTRYSEWGVDMGRYTVFFVLVLLGALAFGCATLKEERTFDQFVAAELTPHVSPDRAYTREDLPELGEEATLSDYLVYAALNNPGLEGAFSRWKAALQRVPQVRSLPDPKFTYSYFIKEVETRTGPQRHKYALQQTFPWFGKLDLQGDVAFEAANVQEQRFETEKLNLFFEVKDAYYEYYYLARAIAITEEHMELLAYLESVARAYYRAGTTAFGNVVKAQVELGQLEDRLRTLKDLRDPVVARLNAALNRPFGEPVPWPKAVPEENVVVSDEEPFSWLKEGNPELKALDFGVAKEKAAIDLARKNYFPDVTLGVQYINTNDRAQDTVAPNPETGIRPRIADDGKDPVIATFSINVPIWYGKYRAGEKEARARYAATLREKNDRENSLVSDLKMTLYNFRDAERKIDLYRDTLIPQAEQSLNVLQQAFAAGRADFLDVIDAERTLLEFELSFERAFANRLQRLAQIEKQIARELPRSE